MTVIDVGPGATDRVATGVSGYTLVDLNNPSSDDGSLDTMEFWFSTMDGAGVKCGPFSGSGSSYTPRDYETIGSVVKGSKKTFTGLDCDVETDDYLGVYFSGGLIERTDDGYAGNYAKPGDQFGAGTQTYGSYPNDAISIYATGTTGTAQPPMQNAIPAVMALLMN